MNTGEIQSPSRVNKLFKKEKKGLTAGVSSDSTSSMDQCGHPVCNWLFMRLHDKVMEHSNSWCNEYYVDRCIHSVCSYELQVIWV